MEFNKQQFADEELRKILSKRVKAKRDFYSHLISYLVVNVFLVILNYITSPGYYWFLWVTFGWGVGIVCHGVSLYAELNIDTELEIKKEFEKLKSNSY